jgi:hypothetical protein
MLRPLSRALLIAALSLGYIAWHGHWNDAFAKKHSDDDSGGDDDDSGGDDDDSGGDSGDKGGGDDSGDSGDDDSDSDDAKTQPPVTAGGLYTLQTYPVSEIERPLTMTKGIVQLRAGIGTDLSAKGAFNTFGVNLEGIYGATDNFSVIGGITDAYNFKQFGVYFGFEGALAYDILDIRVAANLHRNAIPEFQNFCQPASSADPVDPQDPTLCGTSKGGTSTPDAALVNLPDGTYFAGGTKFSIDVGLPFRYAIKPQIAIVALQTLMSIDFNGVSKDHVLASQSQIMVPDGMGGTKTQNLTVNTPVGNTAKPDLEPSIGIATNPIPQLSVVVFAQLRIPDFDTAAGAFQVPVTGRVEFSPNQKLDVGLEFTLLNVKPPEGQSPIDNRFLSLFMQSRFGK